MDSLPAEQDADRPPGYGGFWPGRTEDRRFTAKRGMRHERFEDFLHLRARHLPTDATLAMAEGTLGLAAAPTLAAWRAFWDRTVPDVAAFAGECLYVEPDDRREHWEERHRATVSDLLAEGSRHEAAVEMVGEGRSTWPVRDVAMHVLEDAAQVVALCEAGVPFRLGVPDGEEIRYFVAVPGEGRARPAEPDEAEETRERGRWQVGACNPDWASPGFRAAARRGFALCTGFPVLAATLLDMARQGHAKAFVKQAIPKGGTWIVDLAGADRIDAVASRLLGTIGLAATDLFRGEYPWHATVVQEFLPFTHEHRFFCVGHRVVASTASVRTLSLVDAAGRLLDPRVARLHAPADGAGRYDRGEADAVHDRALVAGMARHARALARELRAEGRYHGHYVIDVGLTARGVAAVEVNTFANAGLYAVDVRRLARSLARWYAEPARRPAGGFAEGEEEAPAMSWMPVRATDGGDRNAGGAIGKAKLVLGRLTGRAPPPAPDAKPHVDADAAEMLMRWALTAVEAMERAKGNGG